MQNIGSEESEDLARIIAPLTTDAVPSALGFSQSASKPAAAVPKALQDAAVASAEAHAPQLLKLRVGGGKHTCNAVMTYGKHASKLSRCYGRVQCKLSLE